MIRYKFTKSKLLGSAWSLDQKKQPILTQNIHTFMKLCMSFLVGIRVENAPNSFTVNSVLHNDIK